MRRILCNLVAGLAFLTGESAIGAPENLEEMLRYAIEQSPSSGDTTLLRGLRELHDPGLRPLFGALAGSAVPALRREGILGLAQLESPQVINALMVAAIDDPEERANVLAYAYQEQLITPEQVAEVLSWAGGDEAFEVLLRSWLLAETGDIDLSRVEVLSNSSSPRVAALACTLLYHTGQRYRMSAFERAIDSIESESERVSIVASVLTMIRADRLSGAAEIVELLAERPEAGRFDDMLTVRALLASDPKLGAETWAAQFEQDESVGRRLRLAMAALAAWETAPPEVFRVLLGCEQRELFPVIGACGLALARDENPVPALRALLQQRHAASTMWVIAYTRDKEDAATRLLMESLIDAWSHRDGGAHGDVAPIVSGVERIASIDPEAVRARLTAARAESDDPLCQAILIGLSRAGAPPIWPEDQAWPSNTCTALAVLIETRHAEGRISPSQAQNIHDIAMGWGGLPEVYRLQAAWIALRQDGTARELLARVLAPDDI